MNAKTVLEINDLLSGVGPEIFEASKFETSLGKSIAAAESARRALNLAIAKMKRARAAATRTLKRQAEVLQRQVKKAQQLKALIAHERLGERLSGGREE